MRNWLRDSAFGFLHHFKVPSNRVSLFRDPDAWSDWPEMVTVLIPLFAILAIVFVGGHFFGYQEGLVQGQRDNATITASMDSGSAVDHAWASIMAANNPVSELADCKKKILVSADGRRYCKTYVWLDQFGAPPPLPIPGAATHEGFRSHKWWWPFSP
jgi:hypothetical protein